MNPIAIFYHCLFRLGDEIMPADLEIVHEQMEVLKVSGLLDASSEMIVGCNGGDESMIYCVTLLPDKAEVTMHGLQCRNECRTIRLIEEWLPGHDDWDVLYFHAKGCTHPPGDDMRLAWRRCMENTVIKNWRKCVTALDEGYDVAGCHYMCPPRTPPTQYIMAGNFWWAKASYLRTLPSIMERDRIKQSGIDSIESRYESEVWIGNGPRPPRVKDFHPNWDPGKWSTCIS